MKKTLKQAKNMHKLNREASRSKIGYYLSLLTIIPIFIGVLIFGYFMYWPITVITVQNPDSLPVVSKTIESGREQGIVFDYVKTMQIRAAVEKRMECDESTILIGGERGLPPGEHKITLYHVIPAHAPTDTNCRIYININYQINPIRTLSYTFISESFNVVNPILDSEK